MNNCDLIGFLWDLPMENCDLMSFLWDLPMNNCDYIYIMGFNYETFSEFLGFNQVKTLIYWEFSRKIGGFKQAKTCDLLRFLGNMGISGTLGALQFSVARA